VVHVSNRSGRHQCPDCGKQIERGLFEEFEPVSFRDASIGDSETYLRIHAMRVACCGGTRVEQLSFAMPGFRMTRRFFERIAALCTKLPVRSVAKMAELSWDTVARVDKRAIELTLGERKDALKGLRWIGVAEVSRTGGRVHFTVVTNLLKAAAELAWSRTLAFLTKHLGAGAASVGHLPAEAGSPVAAPL
jgi:transposase